jgi:hypothetical protein
MFEKFYKSQPTLRLVLLSSIALFSLIVNSAVESVELDFVPLDNSVACQRILFRSSSHFKGTVFAVPRVVPGNGLFSAAGVESTRIFNLVRSQKPGFYDLTIYLYFPANEELIKTSNGSLAKKDPGACDWDEVMIALNADVSDANQQVKTISNIPLTSIEMKIPGFEKSGKVGTFSTDTEPSILEYYSKAISVHFEISEAERQKFESQVVSFAGLNASIRLHFQARSRTGSMSAKIDTEGLIANFAAEASAKNLKVLGEVELSTLLKTSLQKTKIEIQGNGGSSADSINKISQQILDKVLQEVSFAFTNENSKETNGESKTDSQNSSSNIEVSAVINVLKTQTSGEFSYEMFSAPEVATAQLELNLQTDRLNDPDSTEITVKSRYLDPSSGLFLNAGNTITIVPAYEYTDEIEYLERREYLSHLDLKTLQLRALFPDITNEHIKIENKTINGNLVAVGSWLPFSSLDFAPVPFKFRWIRVLREANRVRLSSANIPTTFEALKDLPVFLSFSKLGDRMQTRLSNLMDKNEFWNAAYDVNTGRIILTAKTDLGIVRFRERIKAADAGGPETSPIILDEVFETIENPLGKIETRAHRVLRSDSKSLTKQKSIVFNVSRPKVLSGPELKYVKTLLNVNENTLGIKNNLK